MKTKDYEAARVFAAAAALTTTTVRTLARFGYYVTTEFPDPGPAAI
ncbi:hypothetical protein [Streptomyces caelestis]